MDWNSRLTRPEVTVLMPVYNGMPYIEQAVKSILEQTFSNFEFIIVNDFSNDGTEEFLLSLDDPRIKLIQFRENRGIGAALREGIRASKGDYIARLDADDVSKLDRLEIQLKYLNSNPMVGLVGGSYTVIDHDGHILHEVIKDESENIIRWKALFKNPIVHSTVMIRRKVLEYNCLNYSESLNQDYFLWTEMMRYTQVRILPNRISFLRRHPNSLTSKRALLKKKLQVQHSHNLVKELLNCDIDLERYEIFYSWVRDDEPTLTVNDRKEFMRLLMQILIAFCQRYQPYEKAYFKKEYFKILRREPSISIVKCRVFLQSIVSHMKYIWT